MQVITGIAQTSIAASGQRDHAASRKLLHGIGDQVGRAVDDIRVHNGTDGTHPVFRHQNAPLVQGPPEALLQGQDFRVVSGKGRKQTTQ